MKCAVALHLRTRTIPRPLYVALALGWSILLLLAVGALGSPLLAQEPEATGEAAVDAAAAEVGAEEAVVVGTLQDAEASWELRPSGWNTRPTTVSATATDADGLQPATSAYRLSTDGGGTWGGWVGGAQIQYSSPDATTVHMTATVNSLVDSGTLNRVQFRITDGLENVQVSAPHNVLVDGTAPAAPISLAALPASWTNVDGFALDWTNPADTTGVVRAYHKLGSTPPSSLSDYTGAADGAGVQSIPGVTLGTPGVRTAYIWLEDAVGNRRYQNYSQVSLYLDQQAPASPIGATVDPAGWTSTNSFVVQWTNPPNQGAPISRVYYKFDAAPVHGTDSNGYVDGNGISQINGLMAPRVGEVPCYLWLADQAGNVDHTTAVAVTLRYAGTAAPDRPFALQLQPSGWTSTNTFDATWTNPAVASGICAAWYKWGAPPTHVSDGTRVAGANIQSLSGLQAPAQGQVTLYVWLEDCVGNSDHAKRSEAIARWDITPPTTSHTTVPPLPATGWYQGDVTVNLQASDAHSGVRETLWGKDGGLATPGTSFVATDSTTVFRYWSIDNANNEETAKTLTLPIDKQPPSSSLSLTPPEPASGWYAEPVTVRITAIDDLSGWYASWYRLDQADWVVGSELVLSDDNEYTLVYYSQDVAGNQEMPPYPSRVIRVDRTPPTVSATVNKPGQFIQTPVVITIQADDATSGVQRIEYKLRTATQWTAGNTINILNGVEDRTYTYDFRAIDAAGNTGTGSISVNIDTTSPPPPQAPSATPTDWTNQNGGFGICWSNPTDPSGIAGVYYQLDVDPAQSSASAIYVEGQDIHCLSNLSVPTDGPHTVYLWLRDNAGNSDPIKYTAVSNTFRLDRVPPACVAPTVEGPLGDNGIYRGPATVTIRGQDAHSGILRFRYRVNSGAWIDAPVTGRPAEGGYDIVLGEEERHYIEYTIVDAAGNTSDMCSHTVRIDSVPPVAPQGPVVTPSGWTSANNFSLSWTNPSDYAGIAGIYVKKGSAPTANDDGEYHTPTTPNISGLTVSGEGETVVYLWLKDGAGNVDKDTAATVTLRYDATAPVTTLTVNGSQRNGYYISAPTLHFEATDNASGVSKTVYRINDGAEAVWQGEDIVLDREGVYTVSYHSVDRANRMESTMTTDPIKVDLQPPTAAGRVATDYRGPADLSVQVQWWGSDTMSTPLTYDVQYRRGCGNWVNWRMDTANLTDLFSDLMLNNFYYFQVRAKDQAGWVSNWSKPTEGVYKEGLGNPSFELGNFGAWVKDGDLGAYLVNHEGPSGVPSSMVRLGKTNWDEDNDYCGVDEVPKDAWGSIRQSITLPSADCNEGLVLAFWYKLETYDLALGMVDNVPTLWDTFDVWVNDVNGSPIELVLRDGSPREFTPPNDCPFLLFTSPWKLATVDLTPWAGQRIQLDFQVWNRNDTYLPTWVYIDDMHLLPANERVVALPLVRDSTRSSAARPAAIVPQRPTFPNPEHDRSSTEVGDSGLN